MGTLYRTVYRPVSQEPIENLIPILNQSAIFVGFVISLLNVLVARLRRFFLTALIAPQVTAG